MKLSQLKRADTAVVELRNPADGMPTGATVTIYGMTSREFREANDAMRARSAALMRRYRDADKIPTEESLNVRCQFLADLTKEWTGITDDNDQPLPFSRASATTLYSDPDIALQVTQALGDAANFMKG